MRARWVGVVAVPVVLLLAGCGPSGSISDPPATGTPGPAQTQIGDPSVVTASPTPTP